MTRVGELLPPKALARGLPDVQVTVVVLGTLSLLEAELPMQHIRTLLAHGQVEVPPMDIPVEGTDELLEVVGRAEGVGSYHSGVEEYTPSPSIADDAYILQLRRWINQPWPWLASLATEPT